MLLHFTMMAAISLETHLDPEFTKRLMIWWVISYQSINYWGFQLLRDVAFYEKEEKENPMGGHPYADAQRSQNQLVVDEIQAVAHDWLFKMKYMIVQLRINKTLDTTDFKCNRCEYKNFRWFFTVWIEFRNKRIENYMMRFILLAQKDYAALILRSK